MAVGRPVYRQSLDQQLANVADGLLSMLADNSDAARLANWLASVTTDVLQAPVPADETVGPPGFGYTSDEAYAIKLFGEYLTQLLAAWRGAALTALSPTLETHSQQFPGL